MDALTPRTKPIPAAALEHRHKFWDYVHEDAEPWHHEHLGRLGEDWERYNEEYFGGVLVPPYIMLSEPSNPRRLADCGSVSGFGGRSQIRIRPSLLTGTHPSVNQGDRYAEGRYQFVSDILLHEMIHQYHQEITGDQDESYNGHGPHFRDMCNEIGSRLGLPTVRICKARGKEKDLPSCSYWPHQVRDDPTYGGALVRRTRHVHIETPAETFVVPADPADHAAAILRLYSPDDVRVITEAFACCLADRHGLTARPY